MRFIIIGVFLMFLATSQVLAENVRLKTGKDVEGTIVEKTGTYIKVDNGETIFKIPFKMMDEESAQRIKAYPTMKQDAEPSVEPAKTEAAATNQQKPAEQVPATQQPPVTKTPPPAQKPAAVQKAPIIRKPLVIKKNLKPLDESVKSVTGTISGAKVNLTGAKFDGDLSIYEGDGWGANPSLFIFLFAYDRGPKVGRVIKVDPSQPAQGQQPHVHYRWRDPATGNIEVKVAKQGYYLNIEFVSKANGFVNGRIEFFIPGTDTRVSGNFRAEISSK